MRLLIAAAAMLVSSAALAADRSVPVIPNILRPAITPGQLRDLGLKQAERVWDETTHKATQVTNEDAETYRLILEASLRAQRLSMILTADLDGDGQVAHEEYDSFQKFQGRVPTPFFPAQMGERQPDIFTTYDADGDGKISVDEILKYKDPIAAQRQNAYGNRIKELLTLDPNKDGKLTKQDFLEVAASLFDAVDTDKNGILDVKETGVAYGRPGAND